MALHTQETIDRVISLRADGFTDREIGELMELPRSSVYTIRTRVEREKDAVTITQVAKELADDELLEANAALAANVQKIRDVQRVERKTFREHSRQVNMLEELHSSMLSILESNSFTDIPLIRDHVPHGRVGGVIQLSDVHFNEFVDDANGNKYDFSVASQRVRKLVDRAIPTFKAHGVNHVVIALTGDIMTSNRRLSEITAMATSRMSGMFIAVDILQQAIRHVAENFEFVTVVSVTGNESRATDFPEWTDYLASESFDIAIHNMLKYLFGDNERVAFIPIANPLEQIVNINDTNILLVHGHGHGGLAMPGKIDGAVQRQMSKYAHMGIRIDYVLCGHYHQANVSDVYSRSGGMVGLNSYADKGLGVAGRASQNIYLVHSDRSVDGLKVDLQNVDGVFGYPFNDRLKLNLKTVSETAGNVVIQQVLV